MIHARVPYCSAPYGVVRYVASPAPRVSQEFFNTKKLQERVWRLEAENKELKQNNFILHTQYTSQCESQADILKTLHSNLDENFSKIEEQENKIHKLEEELELQKK